MNFDQLQRYTAMACGNMKSNHPLYLWITGDVSTTTPSVINIAANRFVKMYAHKLPEMRATWTIGPTIAASNTGNLSLPSDLLVVYDISVAQQSTTPNWSTVRTYPVSLIDPVEFDYLDKTATGYPIICTKAGKTVKVWPTPDSTTIAYLRWYGLMEETALVNAADVFYMNPDWHPLVAKFAAALIEEMKGNDDRAKSLMAAVGEEMNNALDVVAEENLSESETLTVAGAPTRMTVHG